MFIYYLYNPCIILSIFVEAGDQEIRSQMNQPPQVTRAHTLFKLQTKTLMYSHRYTIFSGENNAPLCDKFCGYHHRQNGPGHMLKHPNESFETSFFFLNYWQVIGRNQTIPTRTSS